jgi:hypothetical protein
MATMLVFIFKKKFWIKKGDASARQTAHWPAAKTKPVVLDFAVGPQVAISGAHTPFQTAYHIDTENVSKIKSFAIRTPLKTPQTRLSDFLTTSLLIVNEGVTKSE